MTMSMKMITGPRLIALASAAVLACTTTLLHAQTPPLPPPDSVMLDKLGYMRSYPPVGEQIVDYANRGKYPQARWAQQHARELMSTRNVRRGALPPSPLPIALRNLDDVAFGDGTGQKTTIAKWQQDNYTDALIVMHKGRIVYEKYASHPVASASFTQATTLKAWAAQAGAVRQ